MRLSGLVAIVTGGGTGIGKGIALLFAKEGASVVVCGRRKEPLDETVSEIIQAGGKALAVTVDISKVESVSSLVKTTLDTFGTIDILVNNAGVYIAHDALSLSETEWDTALSIDLKGVWLCSKLVLPTMVEKGKGKIINITSIAGLVGFNDSAAYCAAKGGVVNLTREMALDYAPKGIGVNAIAPGVITSDMTAGILQDEKMKQGMIAQTPVGKIGEPRDIAYAAVYLASKESDFMVGQTLVVDGGWTIK